MKYFLSILIALLILSSCSTPSQDWTQEIANIQTTVVQNWFGWGKTLRYSDLWEILPNTEISFVNQELSAVDIDEIASIESLNLSQNNIRNVNIAETVKLRKLNLSQNNVLLFSSLNLPMSLTELNLSNNKVKDLKGIEKLINLEVLNVENNTLKNEDLTVLQNMPNLKAVSLQWNSALSPAVIQQFAWTSTGTISSWSVIEN